MSCDPRKTTILIKAVTLFRYKIIFIMHMEREAESYFDSS